MFNNKYFSVVDNGILLNKNPQSMHCFFHRNNGFMKRPQYYVIRTLNILFIINIFNMIWQTRLLYCVVLQSVGHFSFWRKVVRGKRHTKIKSNKLLIDKQYILNYLWNNSLCYKRNSFKNLTALVVTFRNRRLLNRLYCISYPDYLFVCSGYFPEQTNERK